MHLFQIEDFSRLHQVRDIDIGSGAQGQVGSFHWQRANEEAADLGSPAWGYLDGRYTLALLPSQPSNEQPPPEHKSFILEIVLKGPAEYVDPHDSLCHQRVVLKTQLVQVNPANSRS